MRFIKTHRELLGLICFVTFVRAQKELFKNIRCSLYSCNAGNCTWDLPNPIADIRFFYWSSKHYEIGTSELQECSHYLGSSNTGRKGCHLGGITLWSVINYTISGTVNGTTVNKTMLWNVHRNEPPPLQLTAKREDDHLRINWMNHALFHCNFLWSFLIEYTVCNSKKTPERTYEPNTSVLVPFYPDCQYHINVTISSDLTKTSRKAEINYDETKNRNSPLYAAAILLPLMFAAFAVLLFVFFNKYKDKIFPKVPEPGTFLQDMLCDNNMSLVKELSIPNQEEVDTPIILLVDPDF